MVRLLAALVSALRSAFRSRRDLVLENLALRQQLATLARRRRPVVWPADRPFWIILSRLWAGWAGALAIVQPETVIRWHRAGFRIYWDWLSRRGRRTGRLPLPRDVRDLIRRMASENPWGAPRIHGELIRLGFEVSERSVSRYLRSPPRPPRPGQSWGTFLRNHREGITAMDFFAVPTATFRVLYVLLIIRHGRRDLACCNVTGNPSAAWVVQQLREAFPFESAPRHLIFDRDTIFSPQVVAALRSMNIEPSRTSYQSPWQNGVAERFVGTVRRELLDHVIVLNEPHLRRLLEPFIDYYSLDWTHLGLGKDSPRGRPVERRPSAISDVVGHPRVGGLHRRYSWRPAA